MLWKQSRGRHTHWTRLDPLLVAAKRVAGQRHELHATLGKLVLQLGYCPQLRGADPRGEATLPGEHAIRRAAQLQTGTPVLRGAPSYEVQTLRGRGAVQL